MENVYLSSIESANATSCSHLDPRHSDGVCGEVHCEDCLQFSADYPKKKRSAASYKMALVILRFVAKAQAPAVQTFCLTTIYIAIGCVFYMLTEEKPCESSEKLHASDYDQDTCMERWTLIDSLYFSMVTISTVGYGDLSPTGAGSRFFTIVYVLIGITVIFAQLSNILSGALATVEAFGRWVMTKMPGVHGRAIDLDGDGQADYTAPPSTLMYWAQGLACSMFVLSLLQIVSAAIFTVVQPDVGYWEAFYHCIITATTVGYGDVTLSEQHARLWAFFHILFSVSWLAAFIGRAQDLYNERLYQIKQHTVLMRRLDGDLIQSLDKDGGGVDKLEFVLGMLMNLGVEICGDPLTWQHVTPLIQKFDALDRDGSQILTKEDLKEIARMEAEEVQAGKLRVGAGTALATQNGQQKPSDLRPHEGKQAWVKS